eukprot:3039-Heterococcus_DN1.PRE.4
MALNQNAVRSNSNSVVRTSAACSDTLNVHSSLLKPLGHAMLNRKPMFVSHSGQRNNSRLARALLLAVQINQLLASDRMRQLLALVLSDSLLCLTINLTAAHSPSMLMRGLATQSATVAQTICPSQARGLVRLLLVDVG